MPDESCIRPTLGPKEEWTVMLYELLENQVKVDSGVTFAPDFGAITPVLLAAGVDDLLWEIEKFQIIFGVMHAGKKKKGK